MTAFLLTLGLVALLAAGTTLTGRALAGAFGMRWLRRATPEAVIVSAFLGTGVWLLVFGCCSHAGLPAPRAALGVGVVVGLLGLTLAVRGRLAWLLPRVRPSVAAGLLGVCLLGAALDLLPVLWGNGLWPINDSLCYISIAEWLQSSGFGTPCPLPPEQPVYQYVAPFQHGGWRMGAVFLLALVRSLLPGFLTLEVYPAVLAWGVLLNLGGIFVLCRWALRLPRWGAAAAAVVAAVALNPLYCASLHGFFCTVYGTAALALALAVLARLQTAGNWRRDNAVLFATATATLLSVYSELLPVLAIAGLVHLARVLWRARGRWGRFLPFAGATLLALGLLGNLEWLRAVRAIFFMFNSGVGPAHLWSGGEYWAFAMGARPYAHAPAPLAGGVLWLTVLASVCFLAGLLRSGLRGHALPVVVSVALFAALAAYFRFLVIDPELGTVGHTYKQFKICKYAFPLTAALQGAGLYALLRRVPLSRALLAGAVLACLWLSVPRRVANAKQEGAAWQFVMGSARPSTAIRQLQRRVDALSHRGVCYLYDPADPTPPALLRSLPAYLLYPRPFLSGLGGAISVPPQAQGTVARGPVYLVKGDLPFEKGRGRLPAGFSQVDGSRPAVIRVDNPNGLERTPDGGGFCWVGPAPARFVAWSPQPGPALLSFAAQPGPSLPETPHRRVRVVLPGGEARELAFTGNFQACVPLTFPAGVSRIELQGLDRPSVPRLPGGDQRPLLVGIRDMHLRPAPGGTHP
jgi:hypothetical protein